MKPSLKLNKYETGDRVKIITGGEFSKMTGKVQDVDGEYIYVRVHNILVEFLRCEIEHA